jgi:hypothetical protein
MKPASAVQYKVVTLADLFSVPAETDFYSKVVSWKSVPNSREDLKTAKAAEPKERGEVGLQRKVVAEINRLGADGWEMCEIRNEAWPVEVPRFGVMCFRKSR